jgi:signal recognition particle subunit SRP54
VFETLTSRLGDVFGKLRSKGRLGEKDVDDALAGARAALLEADVNVAVVGGLLDRVRERSLGAEVSSSLTPGQQMVKIVNEELISILGVASAPLNEPSKPPMVVMVVGLQGSGKTTTAAKLAERFKAQGRSPMLVAADLQRPAAIDQLETLAGRIGVPVHTDRTGKPERIVKDARKEAAAAGCDTVIIDTAGRLQVDDALMRELTTLEKAAQPDEVLLVVDAMTGQDAVNVAVGFAARVSLTGLVLSKLDGDARGGAAISVRSVTGCPIKFAGVGEGIGDLEVFHPDRMASRILGMGDVLTLIEKAEATVDVEQAERAAEKLMTASFTLEDFLEQFQQIKRMGSLGQLVGMLPGAGSALPKGADVSDADLTRAEAIIRSMTPGERQNPKAIDGSRKRRIAAGSGTTPQQVNGLLRQFAEMQKMMKAFAEGSMPMPGMTRPRGRPRPGRKRKKKR